MKKVVGFTGEFDSGRGSGVYNLSQELAQALWPTFELRIGGAARSAVKS